MNQWQRRAAVGFVSLTFLLVSGRWLALFVTERWWRSELASGVSAFGMWWNLLGTGLDLVAVFLAFAWFALHLLAAMRGAVAGDPSGEIAPRRLSTIPERTLRWGTIGVAMVLAIAVGSGASEWTPDIVLAVHGVTVGVADPTFVRDVGTYLGDLAVWTHLHRYMEALVLLALAGAVLAYGLGGALAVRRGRLLLAPGARRHLGLLGATLAACIAWWYLLMPQLLAAGVPVVVPPVQVRLQETLALILAGAAGGVAVLTLAWGFRATRMTTIASWGFLLFGMAVARFLVPPDPGPSPDNPQWELERRRIETVAYGVPLGAIGDTVGPDPSPDSLSWLHAELWQIEQAFRFVAGEDSLPVRWVGRGEFSVEDGPEAVWWVLGEGKDSLPLFAVSNERTTRSGDPVFLPPSVTGVPAPIYHLPATAVRRQAPRYVVSEDSAAAGVLAGSLPRRLILAWALQGAGILGAHPNARVSWHLDPVDRLRSIAPFADWTGVRVAVVQNRVVWLVDGFLLSGLMPAVHRLSWRGRAISYARADLLAVVSASDGSVELFLQPQASALGRVWAEIAAPMIGGIGTMPPEFAARIGTSSETVSLQAQLFGVPVTPGGGQRDLVVVAAPEGGAIRGFMVRPQPLVGTNGPRFRPADSVVRTFTRSSLEPGWNRNPLLRQLRDSVTAVGGSFRLGEVRYALTHRGVMAYQPVYSDRDTGRPVLLAMAVGSDGRLAVDRTLEGAVSTLRGTRIPDLQSGPADLVSQARIWIQLADSALRRGDFIAFGQAFQALRDLFPP